MAPARGTIATPGGGVGGPSPEAPWIRATVRARRGPERGATIIGGYVYRGPVPELRGLYFFGDFINPRIWSLRIDRNTGAVDAFQDWTNAFAPDVGAIDSLVSFGEDAAGNLYLVDLDGEIFRVTGPTSAVPALSDLVVALVALRLLASGTVALRTRAAPRIQQRDPKMAGSTRVAAAAQSEPEHADGYQQRGRRLRNHLARDLGRGEGEVRHDAADSEVEIGQGSRDRSERQRRKHDRAGLVEAVGTPTAVRRSHRACRAGDGAERVEQAERAAERELGSRRARAGSWSSAFAGPVTVIGPRCWRSRSGSPRDRRRRRGGAVEMFLVVP